MDWLLGRQNIHLVLSGRYTHYYLFQPDGRISFWDEFGVRFNFIAVDYLIYTYEVVSNINQSYPLPLIITALIAAVALTFLLFHKAGVFKNTFSTGAPVRTRFLYAIPLLLIAGSLLGLMKNKQADFSNNLVINELGKNGVFSFFLRP